MGETVPFRSDLPVPKAVTDETLVAAGNACFSISPKEPQKVAEAIPEAFSIVKTLARGGIDIMSLQREISRARSIVTRLGLTDKEGE